MGLKLSRAGPFIIALALLSPALAGCASREQRAANAAIQADTAFQQGNLIVARERAREAVALRDDLSQYWLLLARIEMGAGQNSSAYESYLRVLELDRWNIEALNLLGQLALSLGRIQDVDRYADQLLLTNPTDRNARLLKAAAALGRRDKPIAKELIEGLLTANPDDTDAHVLRARLLIMENRSAEAARGIEIALASGPPAPSGLALLREIYARAGDRAGVMRTLARANALPNAAPGTRLDYAAMLYDGGDPEQARSVIEQLMRQAPFDLQASARILELLRNHETSVAAIEQLAAAETMSLQMKAVLARRVAELGRADRAAAMLEPVRVPAASTSNADAKAALAWAMFRAGDRAQASALLDSVLAVDAAQPRALLTRAEFRDAAGDRRNAIADVRRVAADDPGNVSATLLLAKLLAQRGDENLAVAAFRDGVQANPTNVRLASGFAGLLAGRGREAQAIDVMNDLARAAPLSLGARRAQAALCTRLGDTRCAAQARTAVTALASGANAS